MKIIYIPTTLYLLIQGALAGGQNSFWILPIVFLIVSFVVVDTFPDLIIRPYISGKDLHVGMIMFSYIFGSIIFGWYGIFLGPMICILIFHFGKLVLPEIVGGIAREGKNAGSKKKRTGQKKIGL
jgi:predicted PurR-regulated permease PerM